MIIDLVINPIQSKPWEKLGKKKTDKAIINSIVNIIKSITVHKSYNKCILWQLLNIKMIYESGDAGNRTRVQTSN